MYYAKNGETGEIEFSGTDASTVIQSAVNALPDTGGVIFIRRGAYDMTSTISSAKDGVVIEGEGYSTQLRSTKATTMFDLSGRFNEMRNLWVRGDDVGTVGVRLSGRMSKLIDPIISDFTQRQVELNEKVEIYHPIIRGLGTLLRINQADVLVVGGEVGWDGCDYCVYVTQAGAEAKLLGVMLYGAKYANLYVAAHRVKLIGCSLGFAYRNNVLVDLTTKDLAGLYIVGGIIKNASQEANNTYDEIATTGTYTLYDAIITGVRVTTWMANVPRYCVSGRFTRVQILGNNFRGGYATAPFNIVGTENLLTERTESQLPMVRGVDTVTGNAATTYAYLVETVQYWVPDNWGNIAKVEWLTKWNPETAAGGIRLYNVSDGVTIAERVPGVVGVRTDVVDVTDALKGYTATKVLRLETKGDGTTAPSIYASYLRTVTEIGNVV